MTTLEHIKKVKEVLTTNRSFRSAKGISSFTGISYNFMKALIDSGMVSKTGGRYQWTHEGTPNIRTYNKLKGMVREDLRRYNESDKQPTNTEVILSFSNNVKVAIRNGSAVLSKNGVRIQVQDLDNLEKLLKVVS